MTPRHLSNPPPLFLPLPPQPLAPSSQEVGGMKATQKKAASSHNAVEVRLNRALEEAEQYKTQLQRARTESKVWWA